MRERHFGDCEGLCFSDYVKLVCPELGEENTGLLPRGERLWRIWEITPPGGEAVEEHQKRAQAFMEVRTWEYRKNHYSLLQQRFWLI